MVVDGSACVLLFLLFFFFKQKTAYEMRISDWSSDVCSSDLCRASRWRRRWTCSRRHWILARLKIATSSSRPSMRIWRSEEHTSELQSLMRISYAVFCLKKKTDKQHLITTNHHLYE